MMARGDQRVDPPSASRGAFPVIVLLVLVVALAVVVTGGVRLWTNRPGRAAPGAAPSKDEPCARRTGKSPPVAGTDRRAGEAARAAGASRRRVGAAAARVSRERDRPRAAAGAPARREAIGREPGGHRRRTIADRHHRARPAPGPPRAVRRAAARPAAAVALDRRRAPGRAEQIDDCEPGRPCIEPLLSRRPGCSFSLDAANESADVQARGRLKMLLRGETPRAFPGDTFVSGLVTRPDGYLRTTVILYGTGKGDSVPQ